MAQPLTSLPVIDDVQLDDEVWVGDASEEPGSRDKRASIAQLKGRINPVFVDGVDPGANDDETQGWDSGSIAINVITPSVWVCVDPSEGAAVWLQLAVES